MYILYFKVLTNKVYYFIDRKQSIENTITVFNFKNTKLSLSFIIVAKTKQKRPFLIVESTKQGLRLNNYPLTTEQTKPT